MVISPVLPREALLRRVLQYKPLAWLLYRDASSDSYCYIILFYAIFCYFIVCLHLKRALHGLTIAEEIVFTDTRKIVFTHCNIFSVGKGVITCSGTSQGLWVSHQRVQTQPAGFCRKHVWRQDVLFLF